MKLKVTMTAAEIQTAVHQYLVKAGLRIEDIDTIMNETGQEVCKVNPPIPYFASEEAMREHSLFGMFDKDGWAHSMFDTPITPVVKLQLIFVIDNSGSMDFGEHKASAIETIKAIVVRYQKETNYELDITYVSFNTRASVTKNQDEIFMHPPGGTDIKEGLDAAKDLVDIHGRTEVYLITDIGTILPEASKDVSDSVFHLGVLADLTVIQFGEPRSESTDCTIGDMLSDQVVHIIVTEVTPYETGLAVNDLVIA